jgi:membrane protease YdiL (CAAX protease family)
MSNRAKQRCWIEWGILGFGLPACMTAASSLVRFSIPASQHGSLGQRYVLSIVGGVIAEWAFVIAAWLYLRENNESFSDLGAWRSGSWAAWCLALTVAALTIAGNLRFFPRMGIPIHYAFAPRGYHLVAALATGITAGFCEEILFRGLLMTDFKNAGYGKAAQVVLPGLAFGFSHLGYTVHGFLAGAGIMIPTAILGMVWGIAYLLGRRELLPCMVAHFLNDATALPWIGFFMFKGMLG